MRKGLLVIFAVIMIAAVKGDPIDAALKSIVLRTEGMDESVISRESVKVGEEFSYFEISVFAQPENTKFGDIVNEDGEVEFALILPILSGYWPEDFSRKNLVWLRFAPLYRPPDVRYRGVWIYFSFRETPDFPVTLDGIFEIESGLFSGRPPLHLDVLRENQERE